MTENLNTPSRYEHIAPSDVTVDPRVQRFLDLRRVEALVRDFNPDALGVPTVSRRAGGVLVWLDGQTRAEVLKRLGEGKTPILCAVHDGLNLTQEAELFLRLNNAKAVISFDLFRIGRTQGDPVAVESAAYLEKVGFSLEIGQANSFRAVSTVYRLWGINREAVESSLWLITNTWGTSRQVSNQQILQGAFALFNRYGKVYPIDLGNFRDKLIKEYGSPADFIGGYRSLHRITRSKATDAVSTLLTNVWNKGRQFDSPKRLPDWHTGS